MGIAVICRGLHAAGRDSGAAFGLANRQGEKLRPLHAATSLPELLAHQVTADFKDAERKVKERQRS